MVSFYTDGKIRIGMLCLSMFLNFSFSSYGASPQQPPDQPAASGKKDPTITTTTVSPSQKPPSVIPTVKNEKKKAPKEGVKVGHPGPPPKETHGTKGISVPLKRNSKNPIDLTTGKELTPWVDDKPQIVPSAK